MPRETKTGLFEDLMHLLVRAPAWLGPLLAVAVFVGLRHLAPMLLPRLDGTIPVGEMLALILPGVAWAAAGLVLVIWVLAEVTKLRQRRLLDVSRASTTRCASCRWMRHVVGGRTVERAATSASEIGRFETDVLTEDGNLAALMDMPGRWVDAIRQRRPIKNLVHGMDSSVSEAYGEQDGTAYLDSAILYVESDAEDTENVGSSRDGNLYNPSGGSVGRLRTAAGLASFGTCRAIGPTAAMKSCAVQLQWPL